MKRLRQYRAKRSFHEKQVRGAIWVRPKLVAEAGKKPEECVRERRR